VYFLEIEIRHQIQYAEHLIYLRLWLLSLSSLVPFARHLRLVILQLDLRFSVPMLIPRAPVLLLRAHNLLGRAAIQFPPNYSSKNFFQILRNAKINKNNQQFCASLRRKLCGVPLSLVSSSSPYDKPRRDMVVASPLLLLVLLFLLFQESADTNQSFDDLPSVRRSKNSEKKAPSIRIPSTRQVNLYFFLTAKG